MQCNDVHIEKFKERLFRQTDDDPAYGEKIYKYTCTRDRGHEGDHKGLMHPEYPESSSWYIWPPAGYIDESTLI